MKTYSFKGTPCTCLFLASTVTGSNVIALKSLESSRVTRTEVLNNYITLTFDMMRKTHFAQPIFDQTTHKAPSMAPGIYKSRVVEFKTLVLQIKHVFKNTYK